MKINCHHIDTCLPDYWAGHSLPHVQISAYRGMSFKAVRDAIRSELSQGNVAGVINDARLLSADFVGAENEKRADMLTRAAHAAINRDIKPAKKGARHAFPDLDDSGDVCAFFVFTIEE